MPPKLLFVLAVFIIVSCGPPEFQKNIRILVKGDIVNEDNAPVVNTEVGVYARRTTSIFDRNGSPYLLGINTSSTDGKFEVISLFDKNDSFTIEAGKIGYRSQYICQINTSDYTPENLTINLPTIVLKTISNVEYHISRESADGTEITYSFKSESPFCIKRYENGELNEFESSCYEYRIGADGTLNDNLPEVSGSFNTTIGSTVEFRYSINGQPEIVETFVIDRENYVFNFSY